MSTLESGDFTQFLQRLNGFQAELRNDSVEEPQAGVRMPLRFNRSSCLLLGYSLLAIAIPLRLGAQDHRSRSQGSPFVPLDSWIYPALKRLAAMGYVPDEESLAAPWTRDQCVTLIEEAEDIAARRSTKLSAGAMNNEALRLISALKDEFILPRHATDSLRIESVYTRFTQISGSPLRDSYHFGQTLTNDFGRPFAQGANTADGISAYGTWDRFSAYFRGEYQESPAGMAYGMQVRNFIQTADQIPLSSPSGAPAVRRFDPLEMYIGAQVGDFNISIGKESTWWGPGETSTFHFSNNAEPIYMLRATQTMPFLLPGPLRWLGRIRTQFLLGRLSGHDFPPRPWINAQKITFQLTPDLELGFTRSAIFGGVGHPLNIGNVARSFISFSSTGSTTFGSASDPGDRRSGFDFRWHLPGLRRFVTIYSDSLADDEPNPLDAPRRSAWGPGIYLTQLPGLQHVDFRLESYSTWLYANDHGGQFIYWNNQYHDAYTNDGQVFGTWVGRDARSYTASSTYWFSAKDKLTASFRQTKAGNNFLPGGGTQTDIALAAQWQLRPQWLVTAFGQYERYFIPVLGRPQKDIAAGFQLTFYPNWALPR